MAIPAGQINEGIGVCCEPVGKGVGDLTRRLTKQTELSEQHGNKDTENSDDGP